MSINPYSSGTIFLPTARSRLIWAKEARIPAVYDAVDGIPQAHNDLASLMIMDINVGMTGEKGDHIISNAHLPYRVGIIIAKRLSGSFPYR
jgi:hypothetical protein